MNDLVALLVLAAALAGLGFFHWSESQAWRTERADLLNRIMARTYTDYVYTTQTSTTEPERPQMISDAAEAAYAKEQEGIDRAWHETNMREHPDQYPDGIEVLA